MIGVGVLCGVFSCAAPALALEQILRFDSRITVHADASMTVQETIEVRLKNRKESDVEVIVVEHLWGDWEITRSSLKYEKKDGNTFEFKVPVPKNSEAAVEYTAVTRW